MIGTTAPAVRFNHVGFTVPRELLRAGRRADVTAFFRDVFGFEERTEYAEDGGLLVLMAGGVDQFVVLFGHDAPTTANPPLDHFGMAVATKEDLLALRDRARDFGAGRDDVEIEDYSVTEMTDVVHHNLHKFYVRFGTPFTIEVQHYEMLDG